jgi:DNA-binding SARP family transcriptional activator/Tfp pilus assembly protein PilF
MEFRLLGPVEIRLGDRLIDAGHARQRAVLAALLLDLNRVLPTEVLIDRVWDEDPPASGRNVLYGHLARLRAALAAAGDAGVSLSRRPGGYVLQASPEQVDVCRFRALAAPAAAADDEQAVTLLREALALWHGPALAGLRGWWLDGMRDSLEQERAAAALELTDARLRLGQHGALLAELAGQAAAAPADERLIGQLMLALYRSGQPAEALRWFERTRQHLAGELGADPGPQLQALHQQVLRADPALNLAPGVTGQRRQPDGAPVPRELPADVAGFTGRPAEMAALDQILLPAGPGAGRPPAAVISAVSGTAGVGKTALAVHWAHHAAERFPDGQLHVNLRGYDPARPLSAGDALAGFLRALGLPGQDIPADEEKRAARYRGLLTGKRMLILIDNAGGVEHVRPLLTGNPACAVLVTSRNSLAGIDGARCIDLDLLPLDDAVALLSELIGARAAAEPDATAALAEQCCRLPLALRIAAEFAVARPVSSLAELVTELADQKQRLNLLDAGGDPRTAVRAVFSWSYDRLDRDTARAFRLAGLHPGTDVDAYAVAALTGGTLDQAGRALGVLSRAHVIQPGEPGRYGMHDLLRAYARDLAGADRAQEEHDALTRLFDHYLSTAAAATDLLYPAERDRRPPIAPAGTPAPALTGPGAATAWLDAERANLVAMAGHAAGHGWPSHATRLSITLSHYLDAGGHYPEAIIVHGHARDAARYAGDHAARAAALRSLGTVHRMQGDYDRAAARLQEALVLFRQAGDPAGEGRALSNLGNVRCRQGRYEQAAESLQNALTIFREIGDRLGEALALDSLGGVRQLQGRYQLAGSHLRRALALHREIEDPAGEAYALHNLGIVYQRQGSYQDAADSLQQALTLFRQAGDRSGEAHALINLGVVDLEQQDLRRAAGNMREALAISRQIGERSNEADALNGLGDVLLASGQPEQARASHAAAVDVASQSGDGYQVALGHRGLGNARFAAGEPARAREHWRQALTLFTELGAAEADEVRAQLAEHRAD